MKRFFATTVMMLAALSFGTLAMAQQPKPAKPQAASAVKDGKAPELTLVEPIKDYGTIPKGDKLNWSFTIKNSGTADLQILAAKPSCGCTVADFDKVIKPGQTGKVTAHVDTTNFSGPISKTVTLETNDPNTPSAQLTLHAVVKPFVEAFPAGFLRYNLLQGDATTQTFTLYSDEDEPFTITSIDLPEGMPADSVKVKYKKIENAAELVKAGKEGQNQYRVDVTLGGPAVQIGPIAEKLKIHTNSKHQPEYPISLTGVVRPTYSVSPTVLNFGEISPKDAAAVRTLTVRSNDPKAPETFHVTKVDSDLPMVGTEVKPTDRKGEYEVKVKLAPNAKAGAIDGNLKIYTSDKINPIATVQMKGTVKPSPDIALPKPSTR
jgi:hypothetical protein